MGGGKKGGFLEIDMVCFEIGIGLWRCGSIFIDIDLVSYRGKNIGNETMEMDSKYEKRLEKQECKIGKEGFGI